MEVPATGVVAFRALSRLAQPMQEKEWQPQVWQLVDPAKPLLQRLSFWRLGNAVRVEMYLGVEKG